MHTSRAQKRARFFHVGGQLPTSSINNSVQPIRDDPSACGLGGELTTLVACQKETTFRKKDVTGGYL
jgi:hypothetical protein